MTTTRRPPTTWLPVTLLLGCVAGPGVLGYGDDGVGGDASGGSSAGESSSGQVGDDGPATASGDDGSSDDGGVTACMPVDTFGVTYTEPTLTITQYDNLVHDLTGLSTSFATGADRMVAGFAVGLPLTPATRAIASEVAAAVDLAALLSCDPSTVTGDDAQACYDAFIAPFARAAWRRAVVADDLEGPNSAFAGAEDFASGVRAAIASVLADDRFLLVAQDGTPTPGDAALVELSAHALASRLALFLWNSGPDEVLLALADSGELLEPATLHEQAERLLADPRASRMVDDFHTQWLGLQYLAGVAKDAELFPSFDAARDDLRQETLSFARSVMLEGDATLATLLDAPYTYANATVAQIYGDDIVDPAPIGASFERVALDPARRGGVLTQPSFAAVHSADDQIGFSRRGLWLRTNLLCTPVPPPPPIETPLPDPSPDVHGHKELWQAAVGDPDCMGCHILFDPLSFPFDNLDPVGAWTDVLDGAPVDPSGTTEGFDFADREDLVNQLLASDDVAACMVRQYARYALDRDLEQADACTLETLRETLRSSGGDLRTMMISLVDAPMFRHVRSE